MTCKNCETLIKRAIAHYAGAATSAAETPSPVLVGRFNDAGAAVLRLVKDSWACADCRRQASQKLPLFPELES